MSFGSFFLARAAKLPRRRFRAARTRGLMIRTRDGIDLETDLYAPRAGGAFPTMLIRVPYGLRAFGAAAEAYAERGVVAASGTVKSLLKQFLFRTQAAAKSNPEPEAHHAL